MLWSLERLRSEVLRLGSASEPVNELGASEARILAHLRAATRVADAGAGGDAVPEAVTAAPVEAACQTSWTTLEALSGPGRVGGRAQPPSPAMAQILPLLLRCLPPNASASMAVEEIHPSAAGCPLTRADLHLLWTEGQLRGPVLDALLEGRVLGPTLARLLLDFYLDQLDLLLLRSGAEARRLQELFHTAAQRHPHLRVELAPALLDRLAQDCEDAYAEAGPSCPNTSGLRKGARFGARYEASYYHLDLLATCCGGWPADLVHEPEWAAPREAVETGLARLLLLAMHAPPEFYEQVKRVACAATLLDATSFYATLLRHPDPLAQE